MDASCRHQLIKPALAMFLQVHQRSACSYKCIRGLLVLTSASEVCLFLQVHRRFACSYKCIRGLLVLTGASEVCFYKLKAGDSDHNLFQSEKHLRKLFFSSPRIIAFASLPFRHRN